jgi:hypothetical protein
MRSGEPDWAPLEAAIGPERCGAFMFIGYAGAGDSIRLYKHADTRRYLNLDPDGNAYVYASGDHPAEHYHPLPLEQAIACVFDDPAAARSPERD